MTITDVPDGPARAAARSIYRSLNPSRMYDAARPEVQALYMDAARAAVVIVRLDDGIEAARKRLGGVDCAKCTGRCYGATTGRGH